MSMHRLFADWYQVVTIESKGETLSKRWEGIEEVIKSLKANLALDIVRLFFKKHSKDSEFSTNFAEYFKKVDNTFLMRGNDLELQVLAGATIMSCLDTSQKDAMNIAYGVVCSDFQGLAPLVPIPEAIDYANKYLLEQSIKIRSRSEFTQIEAEIKADDLPSSMKQIMDAANKRLESLSNSLQIQREESAILWWLFGEYSNDVKSRMADLGLPAASLIAGKELADLTLFVPGHLSSEAILDKMLRTVKADLTKTINLKDTINATPLTWRKQLLEEIDLSGIEDLCPILYAIGKSVETGDNNAWAVVFEKSTGLKAEAPISAVRLAMQILQESLFVELDNE